MDALNAAALVALFAVADRFAGGGLGAAWVKRQGVPGSLNAWTGLAVTLVLTAWELHDGPPGAAALGMGWAIYRNLGFPRGAIDFTVPFNAWVRHAPAVAIPVIVTAERHPGAHWCMALGAGSAYALVATALAWAYGRRLASGPVSGDPYAAVELTRGAAFGLLAAYTLTA